MLCWSRSRVGIGPVVCKWRQYANLQRLQTLASWFIGGKHDSGCPMCGNCKALTIWLSPDVAVKEIEKLDVMCALVSTVSDQGLTRHLGYSALYSYAQSLLRGQH